MSRSDSTRERILDAAETLFADGLDVTFRQLTELAGVNLAAIHYHYGSKEELLAQLFRDRCAPIVRGRVAMLHDMPRDAQGRASLEDILKAFLAPAVQLVATPGGRSFARLRARIGFESNETAQQLLAEIYDASNKLFIAELKRTLPELSQGDIYWRFHFTLGAMQYTMGNPGRIRHLSGGVVDPASAAKALPRLVAFTARDFAPPHHCPPPPFPERKNMQQHPQPERTEFVIRGAHVVTMDAQLGDIDGGDVHVRNGSIVAVGRNLQAPAAQEIDGSYTICMPGFVDTHWHMWTSLFRGYAGSTPERGYLQLRNRYGDKVLPKEVYHCVRVSLAEALNAGITTVHNWAHNMATPQHADETVDAHQSIPLRARFSYGAPHWLAADETMDLDEVARVRKDHFSIKGEGLLHMGVAIAGRSSMDRHRACTGANGKRHARSACRSRSISPSTSTATAGPASVSCTRTACSARTCNWSTWSTPQPKSAR